jgi:7-cyano-7-deazaguanine synthase
MKTAILLSGGLDSYAVTYWKRPQFAITIDYGQVASSAEIDAARTIAKKLQIEHDVIHIDCSEVGQGDMAQRSKILEYNDLGRGNFSDWWPFRNQLIITFAAAHCIKRGISQILTGTVKSDSRFKDGTNEFFSLIDRIVSMQEGEIHILAPAIGMDSVDLLRISKIPFGLAAWSHSCHRSNIACGECKGCEKRRLIFDQMWGVF